MKYKFISAVFLFVLLTVGMFLYYDHFNEHPVKMKFYYAWDKVKDFLLFLCIAVLIRWNYYKLKIVAFIISIFFFIRVIWQVWEMGDYTQANQPFVIDILFGALMLVNLIIIFMPEKTYTYLKNKMKWLK